jgi:hypothetical protein
MDWIASLFSSSGLSFRSGAVATKMAEESERRLRLLPHNSVKRKSGNKCLSRVYFCSLFGMMKSSKKSRIRQTQIVKIVMPDPTP